MGPITRQIQNYSSFSDVITHQIDPFIPKDLDCQYRARPTNRAPRAHNRNKQGGYSTGPRDPDFRPKTCRAVLQCQPRAQRSESGPVALLEVYDQYRCHQLPPPLTYSLHYQPTGRSRWPHCLPTIKEVVFS